jgi:hypothetical protein
MVTATVLPGAPVVAERVSVTTGVANAILGINANNAPTSKRVFKLKIHLRGLLKYPGAPRDKSRAQS